MKMKPPSGSKKQTQFKPCPERSRMGQFLLPNTGLNGPGQIAGWYNEYRCQKGQIKNIYKFFTYQIELVWPIIIY